MEGGDSALAHSSKHSPFLTSIALVLPAFNLSQLLFIQEFISWRHSKILWPVWIYCQIRPSNSPVCPQKPQNCWSISTYKAQLRLQPIQIMHRKADLAWDSFQMKLIKEKQRQWVYRITTGFPRSRAGAPGVGHLPTTPVLICTASSLTEVHPLKEPRKRRKILTTIYSFRILKVPQS